MIHVTPRLLIDRLGPREGTLIAALLTLAVATLDDMTGYALRLSLLYLIPIALISWTVGKHMGYVAATLASLLWLFSFRSEHLYPHQAYYFWEAIAMFCGFLAFAWLSSRLHDALNQADERFFRVLDEMQAAVYVADERNGVVVYANPVMQRMANEHITAPYQFEQRFQPAGENGAATSGAEARFASGTVRDIVTGRWYLRQSGPIPWGSNPRVMLKVLTDITDQINAERLREKHLESMHQAAQVNLLAETASTLAHEINQPLMVIATYTDACQRLLKISGTDSAEIATILEKCHAQAVRAASIIQRLRDFIRQRQHQAAPCEVGELVAEAIDMVQPMLDEARIGVDLALATPGTVIEIDRALLLQVIVNLLRNAIDAMCATPLGQRRIGISITHHHPCEIRFAIADRGSGLDAATREKIFTPFFTSKTDGLGLGLTICRSVAEAHDGRLWADDNPGGGAIFNLSLPAPPP